jgi:hypothetical protein
MEVEAHCRELPPYDLAVSSFAHDAFKLVLYRRCTLRRNAAHQVGDRARWWITVYDWPEVRGKELARLGRGRRSYSFATAVDIFGTHAIVRGAGTQDDE